MSPLAQLTAAGLTLEALPNGQLRATGVLTAEIDALLRANKVEILAELVAAGVARRRERALAILAEHPERRIAVIAEAGDPVRVTVAIRDVAVGELTIPADRFDALALLKLMEEHGGSTLH